MQLQSILLVKAIFSDVHGLQDEPLHPLVGFSFIFTGLQQSLTWQLLLRLIPHYY